MLTSDRKERDIVQGEAWGPASKESEDEQTYRKTRSDRRGNICKVSIAQCLGEVNLGIQPHLRPQAWVAVARSMRQSHREVHEEA